MSEASKQLQTHQEQLDADGCMVGVSRQAVEEVIDEWKEARDWLDACMGMVDGRGPPNWDGLVLGINDSSRHWRFMLMVGGITVESGCEFH